MRVWRFLAAGVLVVSLGMSVSGCSSIRCWGAQSGGLDSSIVAPQVDWFAAEWFGEHPGAHLEVCTDDHCQAVRTGSGSVAVASLVVPLALPAQGQDVRLTAVGVEGTTVLFTASARTPMSTWTADAGTCFAQTGHRVRATITPVGGLTAG